MQIKDVIVSVIMVVVSGVGLLYGFQLSSIENIDMKITNIFSFVMLLILASIFIAIIYSQKRIGKRGATLPYVVIALVIVSVIVSALYLKTNYSLTTISADKIYIGEEGGYIEGNKLKGCYWYLVFSLNDVYVAEGYKMAEVKIPKDTRTTVTINGKTYNVLAKKTIKLQIIPKQAYLVSRLKKETIMVTPRTYTTVSRFGSYWAEKPYVEPLMLDYYNWEKNWVVVTTYTVKVIIDGKVVAEKTYNTHKNKQFEDSPSRFTLDVNGAKIEIESLGSFAGSVTEPQLDDIMIFSRNGKPDENYIYKYDEAYHLIKYDDGGRPLHQWGGGNSRILECADGADDTYSVYWFHNMRWNPDNENNPQEIWETPAGVYVWGSMRLELLNADNWGGWINADNITHYKRKPVRPVIFPDEKTSYMRNMGSRGYCVTEFLEKINNVKNRGKKAPITEQIIYGPYISKWDIIGDRLFVYYTWNAYDTPVVVAKIPVELADTWVEVEQISKFKIIDVGWDDGTTSTEISIEKTGWIKIKQESSVTSTGKIEAISSSNKCRVDLSETTLTLEPNEERTIKFIAINLGVDKKTSGTITFKTYNMKNELTSTNSDLKFTLIPQATSDVVTLYVTVKEGKTGNLVHGIDVVVESDRKITEATNEYGRAKFELGTYVGKVKIWTEENEYYQSSEPKTIKVEEGINNAEIEIYRKGEQPEPQPTSIPWEIIAILIIAITITIVVVARRK